MRLMKIHSLGSVQPSFCCSLLWPHRETSQITTHTLQIKQKYSKFSTWLVWKVSISPHWDTFWRVTLVKNIMSEHSYIPYFYFEWISVYFEKCIPWIQKEKQYVLALYDSAQSFSSLKMLLCINQRAFSVKKKIKLYFIQNLEFLFFYLSQIKVTKAFDWRILHLMYCCINGMYMKYIYV